MRKNVILCMWCLVAAALVPGSQAAGQSGSGQARISLAIQSPRTQCRIGDAVDVDLSLAYQNLPPRSRIYAHLLPLADKAWVTLDGATLTAEKPSLNLSGSFVDKDNSIFKVAVSNHPISMLITEDQVASITNKMAAKSICGGKDGFGFTLSFLVAVSDSGNGSANTRMRFTVPDYPHFYNGILITPFLLTFGEGDQKAAYMDADTMQSDILYVLPNQTRPPESNSSADQVPGRVEILSYSPKDRTVRVGALNSITISIQYAQLPPKTAVYVALFPMSAEKRVTTQGLVSVDNISSLFIPDLLSGDSPEFGIPAAMRPLTVPSLGGDIEACFAGVVTGNGIFDACITFAPPPYSRKYQDVLLMPVLLVITQDGQKAVLDTKRFKGVKVGVSDY